MLQKRDVQLFLFNHLIDEDLTDSESLVWANESDAARNLFSIVDDNVRDIGSCLADMRDLLAHAINGRLDFVDDHALVCFDFNGVETKRVATRYLWECMTHYIWSDHDKVFESHAAKCKATQEAFDVFVDLNLMTKAEDSDLIAQT